MIKKIQALSENVLSSELSLYAYANTTKTKKFGFEKRIAGLSSFIKASTSSRNGFLSNSELNKHSSRVTRRKTMDQQILKFVDASSHLFEVKYSFKSFTSKQVGQQTQTCFPSFAFLYDSDFKVISELNNKKIFTSNFLDLDKISYTVHYPCLMNMKNSNSLFLFYKLISSVDNLK